ncbi:conserved hypothetical protein [Desulfocicer vacuolatum DSM 3385]|uniref:Uncharacterized protein n=1 Tax=Desulfocicer vacuolatum DSM 3385 TaxID=1121400 RepID=A0A1W2CLZ3_9BACT|nr:TIGR02285 family protein [Desulfocicer vacuolatum]SMC86201.1 conserved hypothetical protein [Desulfocicer vacuolatum DSM 3385]
MRALLISLITLLLCCNVSHSKEKITWMVLDWPPWMMIDGEEKGTGRFNYILDTAQKNLPEYEHVTERMNWARFWHEIESDKNICYTFGLKTGKRENIVYYSAPHTFVLPNAIIMKKETAQRLGNPVSYSITKLLKENRIKGYAEKNRSFTRKIDSLMKNHENDSNLTRVSESPESLIKMVIMGRVDYTIEYPIVATYYQKKSNAPNTLISIPISEMDPISYVYMNCSKNEWGKKVIEKWNAALKKIKPTAEYRKITEIGHTDEKELLLIRKYYDAFIQEQN